MVEGAALTPYVLAGTGLVVAVLGWLFKNVIQLLRDVAVMQTAIKFYFENSGKGAAMVLDSPNPTPPDIRVLLRKHQTSGLNDGERTKLIEYLRRLREDNSAPKSERMAATQLLAAMHSIKLLKGKQIKWTWLKKLLSLFSHSSSVTE